MNTDPICTSVYLNYFILTVFIGIRVLSLANCSIHDIYNLILQYHDIV